MRCFVAIELPAEIRGGLVELIGRWASVGPEVRFCRAEQLHVTLKFVGEIAPDRVEALQEVVGSAARNVAPFSLEFGGLGVFPSRQRARVLWYGAADPGRGCAGWLACAQPGLRRLGIADEERPFQPHVTLARVRSPAGGRGLQGILNDSAAIPAYSLRVQELTLFESRLGPGGAAYRAVARFQMA